VTLGDIAEPVVANPFSTRYVRPGAIPFVFGTHDSAEATVARFIALGRRAQIVGPHGVGKSTLLAALLPALAAAGMPGYLIGLRDQERSLPADWQAAARHAKARTIVVDGYEQLNRWNRWRLSAVCRRAGWALLITAHEDAGLPTLDRLAPSLATVQALVDRLLGGCRGAVSRERVAQQFADCGGNARETFFALYDDFEPQRQERHTSSSA